ncbi:MAG: cofactor-independent phosphoglycerate mutase [Pseudomonadota bacterium]|nr:cofactor-independent phosphoglycerate mutase [Pseudomonadota bacterium]
MKYLVLLGDGMADYPLERLGGKTPLEAARTPHMDFLAREGILGLVDTIPQGFKPGSDVANLSVLGYDPATCYSGRGPLEAANMGVALGPRDAAFRCNLVTLGDGEDPTMDDFTAGHIASDEAAELVASLQDALGCQEFEFYPGVSYRHLFVWRNGAVEMQTTPPHDITGRETNRYLPAGPGSQTLIDVMTQAKAVLATHRINAARKRDGKHPANAVWLWGQGRAPQMVKLTDRYGLRGGVISAVDLLNGIGIYAGLQPLRVEGATGYTDTNYRGKAERALAALEELDFVFVHVEAPDEMGHEGNLPGKIEAIEDFDNLVVGTALKGLPGLGAARILVLSDHPTPIAIRTHASDPSPFVAYSTVAKENRPSGRGYSEAAARDAGRMVTPGSGLMDLFISPGRPFFDEPR